LKLSGKGSGEGRFCTVSCSYRSPLLSAQEQALSKRPNSAYTESYGIRRCHVPGVYTNWKVAWLHPVGIITDVDSTAVGHSWGPVTTDPKQEHWLSASRHANNTGELSAIYYAR